jgi:predicted aspartyl protease
MIRYPIQIYPAKKTGNLLWVKASVGGQGSHVAVLRLLIDTGASYTILPLKPLKPIGYNLDQTIAQRKIVTASGVVDVPFIKVDWLNCLGIKMDNFPVALYDLPVSSRIDGILGMDFLVANRAIVATGESEIYLPI